MKDKEMYVFHQPGGPYGEKLCQGLEYGPQGRMPRAVRETEYIVFPYTDRPRPANNLFIYYFFGWNGCTGCEPAA